MNKSEALEDLKELERSSRKYTIEDIELAYQKGIKRAIEICDAEILYAPIANECAERHIQNIIKKLEEK